MNSLAGDRQFCNQRVGGSNPSASSNNINQINWLRSLRAPAPLLCLARYARKYAHSRPPPPSSYQQIDRQIDRCGRNVRKFTALANTDRDLMEFHAKLIGLYTDAPRADVGYAPCVVVQVQATAAPVAPTPGEEAIDTR